MNYVVTPGSVVIFVATATDSHFQHLNYPAENLRRDVDRVSQTMRSLQRQIVDEDLWFRYSANHQPQPAVQDTLVELQQGLARLFALLIAPVLGAIQNKPHWVIIPHGPLHRVAWSALRCDNQYLVERHSVSLLPSASLGAVLKAQRVPAVGDAVFFADPDPSHSNLRLPASQDEVEAARKILSGGPKPLVGTAANKREFFSRAADARLLHLACHHFFDASAPLLSFLKLAGDGGDKFLYAFEIADLDLNAQLVALSACQSGLSVVGTGDEQMGIVRSFLAAGALSVVSTLWSIEDRSAAAFFQEFYAKSQSLGLAQALAAVQRRFLAVPQLSLPFFWAPYLLTGRWKDVLAR